MGAKVLGGGTAINGGLFIEEEPQFFRDSFGDDFDTDAFFASSKYIADTLATPLKESAYGDAYGTALSEIGLGQPYPQASLRMRENSSWVALSTINTSAPGWPRRSAAVLLHQRRSLPNLRFFTEHQVTRINFDGQRAIGVNVLNPQGFTSTIQARKGVILATGAVYTPQLLQVSGVGDTQTVAQLGVPLVASNSAVGQNFVDRNILNFGVWSGTQLPLFMGYSMASNMHPNITLENEGWGEVASQFALASLALVPPEQRTQALRAFLKPLLIGPMAGIMDNMIQFVALQHMTYSRGTVQAQSNDVTEPPVVNANKLSDSRDIDNQFEAMATLSRLLETSEVQSFVNPSSFAGTPEAMPAYLSCMSAADRSDAKAIVLPCLPREGSSREAYVEYFRKNVISSYHYFGSASYGSATEGPDFHVKGVSNVHVVDASVFPHPTKVNPQGTIMAMGHYLGTRLAQQGRRLGAHSSEDVYV